MPQQRGRPRDEQREKETRTALIAAAADLLKERSYDEIAIREIGRQAGINPAMISYHFGSKAELFASVIEKAVDLEHLRPDPSAQPREIIEGLVRRFVTIHRRHPWLARLIVDQIVVREGKLRRLFIGRVIGRQANRLQTVIEQLQASGYLRQDADPKFALVSLMSLLAFPFAAAPVLKGALDFDARAIDPDAWIDHVTRVFMEGLAQ